MKESVKKTKHPWMAAVAVVAIAAAYFMLQGKAEFPEPGPNLSLNVATWADLDNVETRYEETGQIEHTLEDLQAMALGHDGKLYIAGARTIAVFENDAEIRRFEIEGTAKCLAVAEDGTLFAGFPDHVEVLDATGALEARWTGFGPREAYITSIAVRGDEVFVADVGNRVIMRFSRDGEVLGRIGEANPEADIPGIEVPSPYLDLAVNADGDLWVVNPGRLGLERYRPDGSLVTSWYKPTLQLEGFSGCCNPTHIAFGNNGELITAEKGLVRIKVYDVTSGEYEELVAGSKTFPREQSLKDLVVDAKGRILVIDPRKNAIRIFERKEEDHGETVQSD